MPVSVIEESSDANNRLTAIRLSMLTLRAMERWKRNVPDYDSAMILVAVVAITAERFTRTELPSEMKNLAQAMPDEQLAPCNVSSIAAATGLNRETARRKVKSLMDKGYLVKVDDGSIRFRTGLIQERYISELIRTQLDALVGTVNGLCRDGTLLCEDGGRP